MSGMLELYKAIETGAYIDIDVKDQLDIEQVPKLLLNVLAAEGTSREAALQDLARDLIKAASIFSSMPRPEILDDGPAQVAEPHQVSEEFAARVTQITQCWARNTLAGKRAYVDAFLQEALRSLGDKVAECMVMQDARVPVRFAALHPTTAIGSPIIVEYIIVDGVNPRPDLGLLSTAFEPGSPYRLVVCLLHPDMGVDEGLQKLAFKMMTVHRASFARRGSDTSDSGGSSHEDRRLSGGSDSSAEGKAEATVPIALPPRALVGALCDGPHWWFLRVDPASAADSVSFSDIQVKHGAGKVVRMLTELIEGNLASWGKKRRW